MLSAGLHCLAVTAALQLASHMKPLPSDHLFRWQVSLVSEAEETLGSSPIDSPGVDALVQRHDVPLQPDSRALAGLAGDEVSVPQRMPTTESALVARVEQSPPEVVKPAASQDASPAVQQLQAQPTEPVTSSEQSSVMPQQPTAFPHEAQEAMPLENETAPVKSPNHDVETALVQHQEASLDGHTTNPKETGMEVEPAAPSSVVASAQRMDPAGDGGIEPRPTEGIERREPRSDEGAFSPSLTQPTTQSVQSAPSKRPDYGWLVDSISRRLAELKRYPPTARLNGWEGKVVLRAVILADGQLAELTVQKSSGYEELDAAAMKAVRMACPLPMQRDLGRTKVALNVPVVYALSR